MMHVLCIGKRILSINFPRWSGLKDIKKKKILPLMNMSCNWADKLLT